MISHSLRKSFYVTFLWSTGILLALFLIVTVQYVQYMILSLKVNQTPSHPHGTIKEQIDWFKEFSSESLTFLKNIAVLLKNTDVPDKNKIKLPVFDLYVPVDNLAILNSNLPDSGKNNEVAGSLEFNGKFYRIKARYRGDFFDHWGSLQKSWRIKLRKGQTADDMRTINIMNPHVSFLDLHLTYLFGRHFNLLTPKSYPVWFRLNNKNMGVMLLVEQINEDWERRNNLLPSNIISGEGLCLDFANYSGRRPDLSIIWNKVEAWQKNAHLNTQQPEDMSDVTNLIDFAKYEKDENFLEKLKDIFDYKSFLRWHALLLFSGDDVGDKHNWKLYLQPTTGKFIPVVWDNSSETEKIFTVDQYLSLINGRAIQHPRYFHDLMETMHEFFQQNAMSCNNVERLLENEYENVKSGIQLDLYKDQLSEILGPVPMSNSDFEREFAKMRSGILKRHQYLSNAPSELKTKTVIQKITDGYSLEIFLEGNAGCILDSVILKSSLNRPVNVSIFRDNGDGVYNRKTDNILTSKTCSGTRLMPINDLILNSRCDKAFKPLKRGVPLLTFDQFEVPPTKNAPSKATYFFLTDDTEISIIPNLLNGVTKKKLSEVNTITDTQQKYASATVAAMSVPPPKVVTWEGNIQIQENLELENVILNIKPGAKVAISAGKSIYVKGKIFAEGTKDNPIGIDSAGDSPWGVIALTGKQFGPNMFKYCTIQGGGLEQNIKRVYYSGMISVYDADIEMYNCLITGNHGEDMFNNKCGKTILKECILSKAAGDAIDLDLAEGIVEKCVIEKSRNDGIDMGISSTCDISFSLIKENGDKGVSIGERSKVTIYSSTLAGNNMGLAVKDESSLYAKDSVFADNAVAIAAYRKNMRFSAGGTVETQGCTFSGNTKLDDIKKKSSLKIR